MIRILVILVAIAAIVVLLWSSWKLSTRLFTAVGLGVVGALLLFGAGIWHSRSHEWVSLPTDQVKVEVSGWDVTESGVRLSGQVTNNGDQSVASITADAHLMSCPRAEDKCRVIASGSLDLRMHVPAHDSYPFTDMVRTTVPSGAEPRHWQMHVTRVLGYGEG